MTTGEPSRHQAPDHIAAPPTTEVLDADGPASHSEAARSVPDQRGMGKRLKRRLPKPARRALVRAYNGLLARVPFDVKYSIGLVLRRRKAPYGFLRSGDAVIQVGAPRDLLLAGRSRAIYFSRLVGQGTVLVVEPDPQNCRALRDAVLQGRLSNLVLAESGAWHSRAEMSFLSSPTHPASGVVEQVARSDAPEDPGVQRIRIQVDALDDLASRHGLENVRLVSLTTNGAELPILEGMTAMLKRGCPEYLSLAHTGPGYIEALAALGYEYVARDDRGHSFRRLPRPQAESRDSHRS